MLLVDPADFDATVRTHLANERTFLAWLRTGITFAALGLAAGQILDSTSIYGVEMRALLASGLMLLGFLLVLIGRMRYRTTAIGVRDGSFRPHRRGLDVVVLFMLVCVVLGTIYVWHAS